MGIPVLRALLAAAVATAVSAQAPISDIASPSRARRATSGDSACNAQPATPITNVAVPGNPFQALPTPNGCWVFVSLMRTTTPGEIGIAVLRRHAGVTSLARVVLLTDSPRGMVLTHDLRLLIVAADSSVVFIDAARLISGAQNPIVGRLKEGVSFYRIYVNVTHDDRLLFVSNERTRSITVVDLALARRTGFKTSAVLGTIPVGIAPIALTFSADERYLYTTSERAPEWFHWPIVCKAEGSNPATRAPPSPEGAIFVIDVKRATIDPSKAVVATVRAGCSPVRLVTSPGGATAYVTGRNSDAVLVFDTHKVIEDSAHALIARVPVGAAPVGIAVIDSGKRVVVANSNRFTSIADTPESLTVIDVAKLSAGTGTVVGSIPAGSFPRELRLTADGRTLLVTNFASRTVELVELDRYRSSWTRDRRQVTGASAVVHHLGVLSTGANADVTLAPGSSRMEALRVSLQELGYREGENIAYTLRIVAAQTMGAVPDTESLHRAARELVASGVELIVAGGSTEALVAERATSTIPIVFWSAEPVAEGLVRSLDRPGVNATGIIRSRKTSSEQLEMLNAIASGTAPIGFLFNPTYLPGVGVLELMRRAADSLGIRLEVVEARDSVGLDAAFDTLAARGVRAVVVGNHGLFRRAARRIAELSIRHKLPTLSPYPEARDAGVLISAVPDFRSWSRRAAVYVDRILRGASPADLPVEQTVAARYTVNLRTAAAIGITVPDSVLRLASTVVR